MICEHCKYVMASSILEAFGDDIGHCWLDDIFHDMVADRQGKGGVE